MPRPPIVHIDSRASPPAVTYTRPFGGTIRESGDRGGDSAAAATSAARIARRQLGSGVMATPVRAAHALRARRVSTPRAVLAVAVLGSSMAFIDASSVNIAIPNIAAGFLGSSLSNVSWVLNAYSIVFAAFLVGGGQLADLLGRRRAFSFATIAFTLASALCAVAPTLPTLIAARVVEAAAGALLVPSSLAIVLEARDARERTHAAATWFALAAVAAGVGPPLGALLITASSWRLVFLINVPLGILTFLLARRVIVESRAPGRRRLPDLLGGLVLALSIASLVLAVVKGEEWGWSSPRVLGAFAACLLLGWCFVVRASRARSPVVDLSLLRVPGFVLANAATLLMSVGFFAYTLGNVLFLTGVWHYSILQAGLALAPEPILALAIAEPTLRLLRRRAHEQAHRALLVLGAVIWASGMAYFAARLGEQPDFLGGWLPGMAILGVGGGLALPTLSGMAIDSVPGPRFAVASSLNSVTTQLGAALGVAILIAVAGEETLHTLREAWLFSGGCILAGALPCLVLVAKGEGRQVREASDLAGVLAVNAVEPSEAELPALPSLAQSDGERAVVVPQTVAEFLRNVHVFAELPVELLEQLASIAHNVSLPRGAWLFREGEPADGVYVVRVGHLEIVHERPETAVLNTLTRGAVLGELALLSGEARSGSARALRDSEILKIDKLHFDRMLSSTPALALSLTRALSRQLQASRALPVTRRPRPVTIALLALGPGIPLLELADELSRAMCAFGRVAVLHPGEDGEASQAIESRTHAVERFGPVVERCELDHDHVIMVCGDTGSTEAWDDFCLARADRVIAVVDPRSPVPAGGEHPQANRLARRFERIRGCDLVGYGLRAGAGGLGDWLDRLEPGGTFAIDAEGDRRRDIARMARRLSARALGVVFGGAGARAFAHLGVLEVLLGAGVRVDRVGGVSMGAFVGALLADGHDSASIDACCYEEWVRRNPLNDYTIPRSSLIKGRKSLAMLERVFGDTQIEELSRSLYCASVDLRESTLRIDRRGSLAQAVASSIALPLISPPVRRGQSLLVDGSLLDNLPLASMSAGGEGPVLAIDIKSAEGQGGAEAAADAPDLEHARLPPLTDTMARIALLSSANTEEAARRHADFTIRVPLEGVGMLEFHQIDEARAAGRRAATAALADAPGWLLGGAVPAGDPVGRRTVLRM
jgi:NTE family protein